MLNSTVVFVVAKLVLGFVLIESMEINLSNWEIDRFSVYFIGLLSSSYFTI